MRVFTSATDTESAPSLSSLVSLSSLSPVHPPHHQLLPRSVIPSLSRANRENSLNCTEEASVQSSLIEFFSLEQRKYVRRYRETRMASTSDLGSQSGASHVITLRQSADISERVPGAGHCFWRWASEASACCPGPVLRQGRQVPHMSPWKSRL